MPRRARFPPDYQHEWKTEQKQFIEWLALPESLRPDDVQSQKQYAEKNDVHQNTLSQWKKLPGFTEMVWHVALAYLGGDVADILRALGRKAKKEDVPAIKLALEVLQMYRPTPMVEVGGVIVCGADVMKEASRAVAEYERKRLADVKRAAEDRGGAEGA